MAEDGSAVPTGRAARGGQQQVGVEEVVCRFGASLHPFSPPNRTRNDNRGEENRKRPSDGEGELEDGRKKGGTGPLEGFWYFSAIRRRDATGRGQGREKERFHRDGEIDHVDWNSDMFMAMMMIMVETSTTHGTGDGSSNT